MSTLLAKGTEVLLPREDLLSQSTASLTEHLGRLERSLELDQPKLVALRRLRDITQEVAAEADDEGTKRTYAKALRRYELFRDEIADRKSMIRRLHDELAFRTLRSRDAG